MTSTNYLLITGASKGIGYATAALFQSQGWQVINLSRQICSLPKVINYTVDLSDIVNLQQQVPLLAQQLQSAQRICLIHNAAMYQKDSCYELDIQDFQQVLTVAVLAPSLLNQICLPLMRPGSSILYVGSTLSEKAVKNAFSYVTAKHAVAGMMRATCQDLAGKNIHTACICPGFTDTEMLRSHWQDNPSVLTQIQSMVAFQRLITPAEIAELLLFCAEHPVINGAMLHGNLGQIEN